MAKKGSKENPITTKDLAKVVAMAAGERTYSIMQAAVKDNFCNYNYEVTAGIGIGDTHTVKGTGIVKDDLLNAFAKFNVHLAVIDEVFKHSEIEIDDIDMFHGHELTELYRVEFFKVKSSKGYDCISLKGKKYVSSAGGWMDLQTPEIALDKLSGYKWYNELKTAADNARNEVALYKDGKYTPVEKDDDEFKDKKQGDLFDEDHAGIDYELENAKV